MVVANGVCEGCISRKLQGAIDLGDARHFRAWCTEDGLIFCIGWHSYEGHHILRGSLAVEIILWRLFAFGVLTGRAAACMY